MTTTSEDRAYAAWLKAQHDANSVRAIRLLEIAAMHYRAAGMAHAAIDCDRQILRLRRGD
jgi:hypothetical protein